MGLERAAVAPEMGARELLALIAGCDLLIGMRLHALVFAALAGVPLVAISYDPKVEGVMEQLGLAPATSLTRLDRAALGEAIRAAWEGRAESRAALMGRAAELRVAALRNVELAVGLLGGRG